MTTRTSSHSAPATRPGPVPPPPATAPREGVTAPLTYLVDTGVKPVAYIPAPGEGAVRRTGTYAPYEVTIHDARPIAGELALDTHGFALRHHESALADFDDAQAVRETYIPEMERLVKAATGATRVVVFDHTVRVDDGIDDDSGRTGPRRPARSVHNDYTVKSGPQRVRDLLGPEEAETLLQRRFAIVNVWRPIGGPALTAPLALADAQSVTPEDLVPLDLVYPERTGEIYNATFSPEHRWYTFPAMRPEEVVLIKCYDSMTDGRARFTLHTAFDDPTTPPGAPGRRSIEVRTLAFFDA